MIWLVFAASIAGTIWLLVATSKKTGQLKSENQALQQSREQSEVANDAEITVDRLSDSTLRDRLRDSWKPDQ